MRKCCFVEQQPQEKQQALSAAVSPMQDTPPLSEPLPGLPSKAAEGFPQLPDWSGVLAALRLDERQLHYVKLLQGRHKERMRSVLSARQALAMEVRSGANVRVSFWVKEKVRLGVHPRAGLKFSEGRVLILPARFGVVCRSISSPGVIAHRFRTSAWVTSRSIILPAPHETQTICGRRSQLRSDSYHPTSLGFGMRLCTAILRICCRTGRRRCTSCYRAGTAWSLGCGPRLTRPPSRQG